MNLAAQIFGGIATITDAIGIQSKKKRNILIFYLIAGFFFLISFYLLGAYSGVVTCIVMDIETFIVYMFDKKEKKIPTWLIYTMIIGSTLITSLFYQSWVDLFAIAACIPYALLLIQKEEKNVRLFTFIFLLLYTTFDILVGAYTAFIGDVLFEISTIIAIIRYDLIKRRK
ncbi:MAG: YgjV family protein [Bacilli bacterium]|nr:YgjV family protein [Bacilli bacterium]